ncbi:F-box only protein 43 [Heteronotia binoei]|uniref:F-box only protein 43 n=1 Tax=Heteronotia binoei TaxID=13085 RepID=UPI002931DEF3|nr:F-box only protein 43 [Heteronotia binoei]XP_060099419.1 F-box only protein 43 [Heteronotia binoei]XP_060099420.1 F-box only protein 43 [Heteronotia binoei]XP_060099421.1 F-box only protein 43 [Heteronotia binoei]
MSESHSVLSNILKRGRLISPGNSARYCSFKESCSPSIFHDSGYNGSLKDPSFHYTSVEYKGEQNERGLPEHSKYSHSSLCTSVSSPAEHENVIFLSERRDLGLCTDFFETPKVAKKDLSLRRRLLVSKAASVGAIGWSEKQTCLGSSQKKKSVPHFLSFDERVSKCALDSPRVMSYKPLATSTLKIEDPSPSCQKLRHVFSQQRTSTVDDSNSQGSLLSESVCLSPIQPKSPINSFVANTPYSFADSALTSFNHQSTYSELVRTPKRVLPETSVDGFVTPINRLIEGFHFNTSEINTSPAKALSDSDLLASDSSCSSLLGLDKSEDSLTDQEGSFQELLQKHNESPVVLNSGRKVRIRKLQRSRRLSTLSECGSQSEKEEDCANANPKCKRKTVDGSINEESKLFFNKEDKHTVLNLEDLTRTPALQMIHEVFMQSRSKNTKQNDLSRNIDGTDISVLKCIIARLIGKKMGLEKLDILTELKERDLKHVLGMILGIMTVEGLCSMWEVSKNWREIVGQDKHANQRRKLYIKQLRTGTKGRMPEAEDVSTRLMMARFALRPVQAQAKPAVLQMESSWIEFLTPRGCSPLHQSASKQEAYVKVAKSLLSDEALKPCPRCQCPAKYQPLKKRGLCSQEDCAFDFCISCLCAFHGSKDCYSSSAKWKNRKDALPGSAKSKRNLKRL